MSKGYVSMLLDASGSMQGQEERVVDAANEYLESLKVEDGNVKVAIRLFDSQRFEVIRDGRLKEIQKLTIDDYAVGMRTPLYDSMTKAIGLTEKAAKNRKVVFLIDTDACQASTLLAAKMNCQPSFCFLSISFSSSSMLVSRDAFSSPSVSTKNTTLRFLAAFSVRPMALAIES